jgi:trehalose-phosphatase
VCIREDLGRLAAGYREGNALALLFDYDGTLAPIVTHPALAECPSATLELLARFADLPRVCIGITSSRELADLKTMINLPRLIYAGTSGLELEVDGVVQVHAAANQYRSSLRRAAKSLVSTVERFPGAWIEVKRFAMTVHYRNVNREETPFLKQSSTLALMEFDGSLTTVDASMALEILPAIGWSKGESLRQIMGLQPPHCLPFYAGNDANDAEALRTATELGGVAVGIGPVAPHTARHRLPDTESLVDSLLSLYSMVDSKSTTSIERFIELQ